MGETMRAEEQRGNGFWYRKGLRDGIPIAMGYFAVAFTLGITAKNIGMTPVQAAVSSMLLHASAGQYAAMTVIASGTGYLEMVMTTLIVNLRYLLMSCALSQKAGSEMRMGHRMAVSHYITDEIFGIASAVEGKLNPFYNYGAASVAGPGWTAGTFLGALLGTALPDRIGRAFGVALYGMFMAIIIPPAKKSRIICGIVAASMLVSYLFSVLPVAKEISEGFKIIILTVVIAGFAAWKFPVHEEAKTEAEGGEQ
ncbi:branched-chain amino acid ABC transporter permease [bacterium 1XD8-76]|nr:branched-chain amino acid ABC transporter permease [bacterium 1XD8-76]